MSEETHTSPEDVKQALSNYNVAMHELEVAEGKVQDTLRAVKACAASATVTVDGQFFQVRERKDKLYLCELHGKPRGRPKGSKNTKKEPKIVSANVEVSASEILGAVAEVLAESDHAEFDFASTEPSPSADTFVQESV